MPSCLGLYIEDNLIKYAKVSKNNETLKVESFGLKFYEKLGPTLKQIVEETYSFKTPISINTTNEWYNEIQVFSLLSNNDMKNAISTEFENICYIKEVNKDIYEQKYIITNSNGGNDKTKVIHISVPKTEIEQRKNQFSEYKVNNISPVSIAVSNLLKRNKKGTVMIVNIEKDTTITKVTNGVPIDVKTINSGAKEILEKIQQKENSYAKAYEFCKNATIYTDTDKDLQYEENEHLEEIMPTLFKIVTQVRKIVDESMENIEKIYITGTGAVVNNIDIYFQEYLRDISCEILKPSFISNNSKINIKDYIEVNSAIAIGLQGLEKNNQNINFKSESKMATFLSTNVSDIKNLEFGKNMGQFLEKFGRQFNTASISFTMLVALYIVGSIIIKNQTMNKMAEIESSINETNEQIQQVEEYNRKFNTQLANYKALINNIENLNDTNSENKRYRNTIPNLLNNIMTVIPQGVQLISIQNPSDTQIEIKAKSSSYEEIAYFKAKLKTEGILKQVTSDTGTLDDSNNLIVSIKGELP